jgi:hypothetical protein
MTTGDIKHRTFMMQACCVPLPFNGHVFVYHLIFLGFHIPRIHPADTIEISSMP